MENRDIFNLVRRWDIEKLKSLYDVQHMDLNMLDEDGTPLIVYASKEHKGEIVEWLAKHNANLDAQDKYGKTALIWATENSNNYMAKLLLTHGANPNIKDIEGKTALRHFVDAKYDELENILVKEGHEETLGMITGFYQYGGDCLLKDNKGVSAADVLKQASSYFFQVHGYVPSERTPGKYRIIDSTTQLYFLVDAIIAGNDTAAVNFAKVIEDVNDKTKDGKTALIYAASYGRAKVVEVLLKRGADVNLADNKGFTALMEASKNWCAKTIHLLLQYGADVNKCNNYNETALMEACGSDCEIGYEMEASVKLLLDAGADKNIQDEYGSTAFDAAEDSGNYILMDILENYKPQKFVPKNVFLLDDRLIQAVLSENVQAFESVLHQGLDTYYLTKNNENKPHLGINPYAFDAEGKTLFDYAIENKSIKSLKFMLNLGMNVDYKNKKGQTPLYVAYKENYKDGINLLLSYGADRTFVRKVDLQEFQDAREEDDGQFLTSSLIQAVLQEDKEALVSLLEAGKNASLTDREGKTLFDYAIENNRLRGLFNLVSLSRHVDLKVDINLKNKNGQTPLDKAYAVGFKDGIDLLLSYGADRTSVRKVDLQESQDAREEDDGQFLTSSLIQAVLQEDKEALVSLLEAGKDASLTDREGKTLFDYAIENNRLRGLFNLVSLSRHVDFNIDINLKNKNEQTPLDKAYSIGFKDGIDLLHAFGAKTSPQKVGSQKTTYYHKGSGNQYGY